MTATISITVPAPGTIMPDGSIYTGETQDTGRPMYTTPNDAPMHCNFNQAAECASKLDANGRQDWRIPTKAELNVLFRNRAAIGGFDTTGSNPAGWYWSSSRQFNDLWTQCFSDGDQRAYYWRKQSSLRCVVCCTGWD